MKKTALIFLAVITLLAFTACKKSDVPDGMQLIYGSKSDGYYFYAPEEWTVSNVGNIKAAYASRVDATSMSFAEVFPEPKDETDKETYFFTKYFEDSLAEFPTPPTVTVNAENTVFGKEGESADKAVRYAYNYEYSGRKFGFMQILIKEGERYFIFTYTALLENRTEGKTYYEFYSEKLSKVIESFRFTEALQNDSETNYKEDTDGYILISDSSLSGFDFYVPKDFTPDYSSAIVSATHTDGSNVSLTEATATGVVINEYWENRKNELSAIITGEVNEISVNEKTALGNANSAFAYEYTFVYNGETYHTYQILAIEGPLLMQKGYVFTYTAKESNYSEHIDDITKIIEKVNFK